MKSGNTDELILKIREFLDDVGWDYFFNPELKSFCFRVNVAENNEILNYALVVSEHNSLAIQAVSTLMADTKDKRAMDHLTRFIVRINNLLCFQSGNIDLDEDSGQIRYKVFFPLEEMSPSLNIIRYGIYLPAVVWEKISGGIRKIIYEGASDQETYAQCIDRLRDI